MCPQLGPDPGLDLAAVLIGRARALSSTLGDFQPAVEQLSERRRRPGVLARLDLVHELRQFLTRLLFRTAEQGPRLARLAGDGIGTGEHTRNCQRPGLRSRMVPGLVFRVVAMGVSLTP